MSRFGPTSTGGSARRLAQEPVVFYNISESRARFSELLRRTEAGETIGILRRGKLVAYLVPPYPVATGREPDAKSEPNNEA